jgi:hypothetical protein
MSRPTTTKENSMKINRTAWVAAAMLAGFPLASQAASVCFYEHANYAGESWCAEAGTAAVPAGWNDRVSSVRVPQGWSVTLYEHIAQGGATLALTADEPNLVNRAFNDSLSSYRVAAPTVPTAAAPVCLYEHVGFAGASLCLAAGSASLPGAWNDFASSARVLAGYRVELFEHAGAQGRRLVLAADEPNLVPRDFNDVASSYLVAKGASGCEPNCAIQADITAVGVTNAAGQAPAKGDALKVSLTVRNLSGNAGTVKLTPTLASTRFSDFSAVPLGTIEVELAAGETRTASFSAGPFIDDTARAKHYAIGRGAYRIDGVRLQSGTASTVDTAYSGAAFTVAPSSHVLVSTVYDQGYFTRLNYTRSPEAFLGEVFTRPGEVFTPTTAGGNTGTYQSFPGGFDQMMGVTQHFRAIPGLTLDTSQGLCEQAAAYGGKVLGLARDWTTGGSVRTNVDNHGFDYLIAMSPQMVGGVACGWLGVQVSGEFSFDMSMNRTQILAVHESGHLFGAPHCDPLQGYVMCAGELHEHYRQNGMYVWHRVSRDAMRGTLFD